MSTVKKTHESPALNYTSQEIAQQYISLESVPLCNTSAQYIPALYSIKMNVDTDKIVLFREYLVPGKRSSSQRKSEVNLSRGKYNGMLSRKSGSRIRKMLTTWVSGVEVYKTQKKRKFEKNIAYITTPTLTLPSAQKHTDNEIKRKVLTPFIQNLKRKYGVINYFWVAEPQENGNIHFHMIIDKYIEKTQLQSEWNNSLEQLNYVTEFEKKYHHRNPPSTYIIKFRGRKQPINYLVKYVTKGSEKRSIEGRLWGANNELKELKCYNEFYDEKARKEVRKVIDSGKAKVVKDEFFISIYCDVESVFPRGKSVIRARLDKYYLDTFNSLYEQKIGKTTDDQEKENEDIEQKTKIMKKEQTWEQEKRLKIHTRQIIADIRRFDKEIEEAKRALFVCNQANLFSTTAENATIIIDGRKVIRGKILALQKVRQFKVDLLID